MSINFHTAIIAASRRRAVAPPGDFDAAAQDWFDRIVAAGSTISEANKTAVNAFIVGCKDDLIWSAIKASCILAGADTLAGALVPLVGAAPTNVSGNFVTGDYSRTTGLIGGSGKELNSNRNSNADPVSSQHVCVYISETVGTATSFVYSDGGGTGSTRAGFSPNNFMSSRTSGSLNEAFSKGVGLMGVSRGNSSNYNWIGTGSTGSRTTTEQARKNANIFIFSSGGANFLADRLAFYSIGENLDLALLDARLTTLMGAIT